MAPVFAMIQRLLGGVLFVDDARNSGRSRDAPDTRWLRLRAATQGLPARLPACPRSVQALLHSGSGGLAEQFGHTEKSFEFRMQNISAVFLMLGRD